MANSKSFRFTDQEAALIDAASYGLSVREERVVNHTEVIRRALEALRPGPHDHPRWRAAYDDAFGPPVPTAAGVAVGEGTESLVPDPSPSSDLTPEQKAAAVADKLASIGKTKRPS